MTRRKTRDAAISLKGSAKLTPKAPTTSIDDPKSQWEIENNQGERPSKDGLFGNIFGTAGGIVGTALAGPVGGAALGMGGAAFGKKIDAIGGSQGGEGDWGDDRPNGPAEERVHREQGEDAAIERTASPTFSEGRFVKPDVNSGQGLPQSNSGSTQDHDFGSLAGIRNWRQP
jgi:hypothetical protein